MVTLEELKQNIESMQASAERPSGRWHGYEDFLSFLRSSSTGEVPLFINSGASHVFLYSVLLPGAFDFSLDAIDDLADWNFGADEIKATSICIQPGPAGRMVELVRGRALDACGSKLLKEGQPLYYLRSRPSNVDYFELDPFLSHAIDVHHDAQASAWFHMGKAVLQSCPQPQMLTIAEEELRLLLHASKSRLVRVFDVTRCNGSFSGWSNPEHTEEKVDPSAGIYARLHQQPSGVDTPEASFFRGFQIIESGLTDEEAAEYADVYW